MAAQQVQVSAFDGHPRAANGYSAVIGGNYLAKTPLALELTRELYGDPGLSLTCGGASAPGPAGPVPVAIPQLPAPPAPYTGPAGGGPCDVPDGAGCIREATAHLRAAVLAAFPTAEALAAAPPAEVLREWSGLGYNVRALRLRETAANVTRAAIQALHITPGVIDDAYLDSFEGSTGSTTREGAHR